MHERDEDDFKRTFAASYLATWAAQQGLERFASTARLLPVATADWMADEAWDRWVEVNGVDRTLIEKQHHCCRNMDEPVEYDPQSHMTDAAIHEFYSGSGDD